MISIKLIWKPRFTKDLHKYPCPHKSGFDYYRWLNYIDTAKWRKKKLVMSSDRAQTGVPPFWISPPTISERCRFHLRLRAFSRGHISKPQASIYPDQTPQKPPLKPGHKKPLSLSEMPFLFCSPEQRGASQFSNKHAWTVVEFTFLLFLLFKNHKKRGIFKVCIYPYHFKDVDKF